MFWFFFLKKKGWTFFGSVQLSCHCSITSSVQTNVTYLHETYSLMNQITKVDLVLSCDRSSHILRDVRPRITTYIA